MTLHVTTICPLQTVVTSLGLVACVIILASSTQGSTQPDGVLEFDAIPSPKETLCGGNIWHFSWHGCQWSTRDLGHLGALLFCVFISKHSFSVTMYIFFELLLISTAHYLCKKPTSFLVLFLCALDKPLVGLMVLAFVRAPSWPLVTPPFFLMVPPIMHGLCYPLYGVKIFFKGITHY